MDARSQAVGYRVDVVDRFLQRGCGHDTKDRPKVFGQMVFRARSYPRADARCVQSAGVVERLRGEVPALARVQFSESARYLLAAWFYDRSHLRGGVRWIVR